VTPGRRRGLSQLAGPRGAIALGLLGDVDPDARALLCRTLGLHLTGVVLDADGAAASALDGTLPGRCGLAVDVGMPGPAGSTRLASGATPASARRLGASAAYLRLTLSPALAAGARRTGALAAALCRDEDLPLVMCVDLDPAESAVEAARLVDELGADLVAGPAALGQALTTTWVAVLPADPADHLAAAAEACAAGGVGIALTLPPSASLDEDDLLDHLVPRVSALRAVVEEHPRAIAA
jgi:hypothetical protein